MVTRISDKPAEKVFYKDEFGNQVFCNDGSNNYLIRLENGTEFEILFQSRGRESTKLDGIMNEHLLAILIDRISKLNMTLPCQENVSAINHLEDAMANLHARSYRLSLNN